MSETPARQAAHNQLEKQISTLGELRNAGTRAQEFREWRQATLTLIERMWPDQPTRAQRFRRIPFSPASAKADDRVAREAFERGCAEARRLLHLWLAEVNTKGVTQEAEAPRLAEAVRATLTELNPLQRPAPKPAAKSASKPAGKAARRKKPQLRDMLGFTNSSLDADVESVAPPEAAPGRREGDEFGDALARSIDDAIARARSGSRDEGGEPGLEGARRHDDLTSGPTVDRHMVSYVSRAFIGMAADVEELGVPEGHRERVRLALLDLAYHLDCGSVTWALIRDAVTLVMHYPALGRQALPLLLPYLENAA